ncbi:hypothetical protein V8C26DRAFT_414448 [Trichoderma gracile]
MYAELEAVFFLAGCLGLRWIFVLSLVMRRRNAANCLAYVVISLSCICAVGIWVALLSNFSRVSGSQNYIELSFQGRCALCSSAMLGVQVREQKDP